MSGLVIVYADLRVCEVSTLVVWIGALMNSVSVTYQHEEKERHNDY